MTIKQFTSIWITLILFLVLGQSGQAKPIKFKIATLSPDGSMWMKKMAEGARKVAEATDNRVTFKFYPSGRMGNDKMVLKKIKIGQLHGGAVVTGSLSQIFPANQIYAQPMKFKTLEEIDYIRQHMDQFIINGLEEKGFVTFGLIGGGFSYIMSQNPIETVQDLQHQKVWIPDNDTISQDAIKAFGINPIPLPIADVRISLQSGLIDTVATSPMGALVLQWHTQIKYVTQMPLIYLHAVLAIDKNIFMKVAEADQAIVKKIMSQVSKDIQAQNRIDDEKNIAVLKKRGITFIMPSSEAVRQWEEIGKNASEKMIEAGVLPREIAQELDMHLKTFHQSGRTAHAQ
jgi:TRAP-type C4-dicarboxylate transport system substrate-binding protein